MKIWELVDLRALEHFYNTPWIYEHDVQMVRQSSHASQKVHVKVQCDNRRGVYAYFENLGVFIGLSFRQMFVNLFFLALPLSWISDKLIYWNHLSFAQTSSCFCIEHRLVCLKQAGIIPLLLTWVQYHAVIQPQFWCIITCFYQEILPSDSTIQTAPIFLPRTDMFPTVTLTHFY